QHGLKVDKKKGVIETYELHEGNKGYVSNGEVITPALIEAAESRRQAMTRKPDRRSAIGHYCLSCRIKAGRILRPAHFLYGYGQ
ncbi:hypothetical protein MJL33_30425, partial [Salmonella enterica subsp. enterica serovar Kentucky]|nr:hypothetical protein [Salmonella enterica subsp. enterica serovar Kentucky]